MKPLLDQHPAGLHIARVHETPNCVGTVNLNHRIIRPSAPHFAPTAHISLQVLDWLGRAQMRPVVLCEWLHTDQIKLALCSNPYPTGPNDCWLLCRPNGLVCFAAATPEIARLYFYSITGGLRAA